MLLCLGPEAPFEGSQIFLFQLTPPKRGLIFPQHQSHVHSKLELLLWGAVDKGSLELPAKEVGVQGDSGWSAGGDARSGLCRGKPREGM